MYVYLYIRVSAVSCADWKYHNCERLLLALLDSSAAKHASLVGLGQQLLASLLISLLLGFKGDIVLVFLDDLLFGRFQLLQFSSLASTHGQGFRVEKKVQRLNGLFKLEFHDHRISVNM